MEKVIKDGMVAVIYSKGFGAGWYSGNESVKECLFCPQIVNLIIANGEGNELDSNVVKRIEEIACESWSGFYPGGARDLTIGWVKEGHQFEIREYDGKESLIRLGECQYITA